MFALGAFFANIVLTRLTLIASAILRILQKVGFKIIPFLQISNDCAPNNDQVALVGSLIHFFQLQAQFVRQPFPVSFARPQSLPAGYPSIFPHLR